MSRVGWKSHAAYMLFLCIALAMAVLCACDDSTAADADESTASLQSSNSSSKKSSSSKNAYPESFKPNDKEYPYANIPRIVIYTKNQQKIEDRETEIPAKLQIWGKKDAESEILDLTIRGRGNSSWEMPKKSYKIEFAKKQALLGMPKDKDWALIANYADKTLMKNYLMYHLSTKLGAYYSPRCEFAELYLNKNYLGVYLLTETIKIGKNRVNISKDNSYVVEIDEKYRQGEQVFFSNMQDSNSYKRAFRVHEPKQASAQTLNAVETHVHSFEKFLKEIQGDKDNHLDQWIDVQEYINHYWVQEFSKNPDAPFYTSVYFSLTGDLIKMGPIWDFDISLGGHKKQYIDSPQQWYIKDAYWNNYIFKDSTMKQSRFDFWNANKKVFSATLNVVDSIHAHLLDAAKNNFKKWDILQSTSFKHHAHSYLSYDDAIEDLKLWIRERMLWIDSNIDL